MSDVATNTDECRGCSATVRIAPAEVQRLLDGYLRSNPNAPIVDDTEYGRRVAVCGSCPDLRYGTTCHHCGCLVAVRAKLAAKACPAMTPRWKSVSALRSE